MSLSKVIEELKLVVRILDKLSQSPDGIRRDQIEPLMERISRASSTLSNLEATDIVGLKEVEANKTAALAAGVELCGTAVNAKATKPTPPYSLKLRSKVVSKPSSVKVLPVPRSPIPGDPVRISKEVSQSFTSTLYNIVEGTASLLRAPSCSVYVRQGDEMISIVNVRKKLSFPPQLVRHRVVGSNDAEVLGSGIALNQRVRDGTKGNSSILIFPIFPVSNLHQKKGFPIATIHAENKLQGMSWFDEIDESILFLSSCLIGELMSRMPQMDWISNFYDPITQHIVSPFVPASVLPLPSSGSCLREEKEIKKKGKIYGDFSTLTTENTRDACSPLSSSVVNAVENSISEQLIKREPLPDAAKPASCGLLQLPTPREVRSFLDNIEECWKDCVTASVSLTETDRELQMEVRRLRFALQNAERLHNVAMEKLRLYELNTGDYQQEFKELKAEFQLYVRKQENLHI